MSKAIKKTSTNPERNEPLYALMRGIGKDLDDLEQGLKTLLVASASADIEGPDVHWIAVRLHEICGKICATVTASDEKHIKPWRIAMGYQQTEEAEIVELEQRAAALRARLTGEARP